MGEVDHMHDVFISYSSKETEAAEAVRSVLEQNQITCWMAPKDIPAGSNYTKQIPVAIRDCTVFLLILSNFAQRSPWVPKELETAVSNGKMIIPFMTENCPLNDEFNFLLTGHQRYSAYLEKANAMEILVKRIQAVISTRPTPNPVPYVEDPLPCSVSIPDQDPPVENGITNPMCCPKCGSDQVVRLGLTKKFAVGMAAGIGAAMVAPMPLPIAVALGLAAGAKTGKLCYHRCRVCNSQFTSDSTDIFDLTGQVLEDESNTE